MGHHTGAVPTDAPERPQVVAKTDGNITQTAGPRDIVVFASEDGTRAAAEFTVRGRYRETAAGLPEASNQAYSIPAGQFFSLEDGKITRVTTYYNLKAWIAAVSKA